MTDYLRPIAAYVASQSGHRPANGHPGHPVTTRPDTPDSKADNTTHTDATQDKERTR